MKTNSFTFKDTSVSPKFTEPPDMRKTDIQ